MCSFEKYLSQLLYSHQIAKHSVIEVQFYFDKESHTKTLEAMKVNLNKLKILLKIHIMSNKIRV